MSETEIKKEIQIIRLNKEQSSILHNASNEIATHGESENHKIYNIIDMYVLKLQMTLTPNQIEILNLFIKNSISVLIFENMESVSKLNSIPDHLPPLSKLNNSYEILYEGGRSQILLRLAEEKAFAYDIDNNGKLIRLVGNFKGGGMHKISNESNAIELSSHAGISLGPHTEAPYNCTFRSNNGLSPAPSSLIITAHWNPSSEPTLIIPILPILNEIGIENTLALTLKYFSFTRSDSFSDSDIDKEYPHSKVSIIDFDENHGFSIRYNSYRFTIDENAPDFVKNAYKLFCQLVDKVEPYKYSLTNKSAMIINNYRALHCRDIIKDNRRLLLRLFGLSNKNAPTVISYNPLIVKG